MKQIWRLHKNGALTAFFAACLLVGGIPCLQAQQFTTITRYRFGTNAMSAPAPVMLATQPGNTNIFGVSAYGPGAYSGTIFSLSPDYVENTLYTFEHDYPGGDGGFPFVLLAANDGNFYGVGNKFIGGYLNPNDSQGTFFRLTPTGQFTSLVVFGGTNGPYIVDNARPVNPTSLIKDDNDTFYGTTFTQNTQPFATLYKISAGTGWIPVLVHLFAADGSEGINPIVTAVDDQGNAYGVSQLTNGFGGVFKASSGGGFTIISPGFAPASLAADSQGELYGITEGGGLDNTGEIVKIDAGGNVTVTYCFGPDDTNNLTSTHPRKLLTCSDGKVYGMTYGGQNTPAIIFRMQSDGTPLRLFKDPGHTTFLAVSPAGQLVGLTFGPYTLYTVETIPTATTVGVTNIGVASAVFLGKVNPGSMPAQVWFDYGTSTNSNYWSFQTPAQSISVATNSVNFSASAIIYLYSLSNYPYYFRAHASSAAGEGMGAVLSFHQVIPHPVITSMARTNGSATVNWSCFPYLVYQLQYSTNLATGNWVGIGPATRVLTYSSSATDTNSGPTRWYRVAESFPQ